jgi:hypothetical protein
MLMRGPPLDLRREQGYRVKGGSVSPKNQEIDFAGVVAEREEFLTRDARKGMPDFEF